MAMFKMFGVGQAQVLNIIERGLMFQRAASKSKSVISALNLPIKPKAPPNPYSLFVIQQSKEVLTKFPNLTFAEKSKFLSKKWAELSPEDKEEFIEQFRQKKNEYKIKLENYNNSLTDAQKKELKILKKELKSASAERIVQHLKSKLKDDVVSKPKRPPTPFLKFCMDRRGPNETSLNFKDSSNDWKNLDARTKEKYKADYVKENEIYENNLLEWEKKRIKEGITLGVRSKTLKAYLKDK